MIQITSAPGVNRIGSVDPIPNLLVTTLAVVVPFLPLQAGKLFASAPAIKAAVQCELHPRPLTLGLNPQPQIQRLDQGAPPPKSPIYVDQPTFHPLTLGMNPQPVIQRLDASAPPPKYAVEVDAYPNTLVLGYNPQPQVMRWDLSSPPPKYSVQADAYPNLNASTLAAPAQPLILPLGLPADTAQFMPKFQVQVDAYPNILVLGYPAPPPPISTGAGKHHKRYGVMDGDRLLVFDTKAQAQAAREVIKARTEAERHPARTIRVRALPVPAEVIPLPTARKLAAAQQRIPEFTQLLSARSYGSLVSLYHDLKREDQSREEEEIAMILLHL